MISSEERLVESADSAVMIAPGEVLMHRKSLGDKRANPKESVGARANRYGQGWADRVSPNVGMGYAVNPNRRSHAFF